MVKSDNGPITTKISSLVKGSDFVIVIINDTPPGRYI